MAFPTYFSNLPQVNYALQMNKAGVKTSVTFKDFFRMTKLREDLRAHRTLTLYLPYSVKDNQTPDQISYEVYGDEQFYWIILQINGVVDYYNQWPLSNAELESYTQTKYGGYDAIHHYETVDTYDTDGNLMLEGGLVVDSDFVFRYQSSPGSNTFLSSLPISVSNLQYERDVNDEKREISVLDAQYIQDYAREVRKLMIGFPDTESEIDISEVY